MSNKRIDMTGEVIGRLTVLGVDEEKSKEKRETIWICQCECGNITYVAGSCLRRRHTLSCGCLKKELEIQSRKNPEIYINDIDENHKYGIAFLVRDCDRDKFTTFDIEDKDIVMNGGWYESVGGYIRAYKRNSHTKDDTILLHRAIMEKYGDIDNLIIDHKDHNPANNMKSNLRPCPARCNVINKRCPNSDIQGKHPHVCFNKPNNSWQVGFKIEKQSKIRQFKTEDEANAFEEDFVANDPVYSEFGYKPEEDVRNREGFNGFHIGGDNMNLHPFYIVDGESMPPCDPDKVINPFTIVDEDKFDKH